MQWRMFFNKRSFVQQTKITHDDMDIGQSLLIQFELDIVKGNIIFKIIM